MCVWGTLRAFVGGLGGVLGGSWGGLGAPDGPKLAPRGAKMAPRWTQEGPRGPKMAQDGPKLAPRAAQVGPGAEKYEKLEGFQGFGGGQEREGALRERVNWFFWGPLLPKQNRSAGPPLGGGPRLFG